MARHSDSAHPRSPASHEPADVRLDVDAPHKSDEKQKRGSDEEGNGAAHRRGGKEDQQHERKKPEPQKTLFYKRPVPMLITGAVLVLATIIGVAWWLYARQYESTDDAFIDGHVVAISPNVAATVLAVHIDDNWNMKKGDLMIELDPRDYQVVVDQMQAGLAQAQDRVRQAQAELDVANANVAQAQAEVAVAQANATNAQRDYQRFISLSNLSRSQEQLDNATANAKSTVAQVADAKAKLAANQAGVSDAALSVKTAQDAVVLAQADLNQARINRDYCKIYAPCDGRITSKNVEPGDYVDKGQPLFSLVPTNVWVVANYKETQLDLIRPGQPVTVRLDAYDREFHGKVDSIQNGTGSKFTLLPPENATGNYVKIVQRVPVKIIFDPGETDRLDFLLAPGMSVVPTVKVR